MSTKEINALLIRIAEGDNKAFEEFYARTKNGVYAFLRSYFYNHADAEDAMQTVYLKVKRGISSYRPDTNGRAWLLTIAKNQALTDLKKMQREVPTDEIEPLADTSLSNGVVTDAMARVLTAEERRIIVLHVLWKYKHREIAKMLNCPTGTVTSKYKRALAKLKKYLKECDA